MAAVIELEGLGVTLGGRKILEDLKCSLSGCAIGLLGPNGAGKSTLINTLLGFYPVAGGTARVFGCDIRTEMKQIRALAGYMPETECFIAHMTAVSFVRLMAELSGLPSEVALERAHEALFYVGLGEARYRKLGTYSLGMKQLAKLAQAIAHGPRLLILDEPTNGLDPPARQRMIRLIREMRDRRDLYILLCSHLLRDVEETCEEVLILKDGRQVHYANLEEERKANRRFLELETLGGDGTFAEAVERLDCECATSTPVIPAKPVLREGGGAGIQSVESRTTLKMILGQDFAMRDLYRLAEEHGVQIRRLNYRRDSLEDIFLKAMENRNGRL
jgi:ABC-2 type transport system ATP-binding protein